LKFIVPLFVLITLLTSVVVTAVPDSVVTGPYKISFDLGNNRNETYNVTVNAPKVTESLNGEGKTEYEITIQSVNMETINASGINKSTLSHMDKNSALKKLVFTSGAVHTAKIWVSEFKNAARVNTADEEAEDLKSIDGSYQDFRVAKRDIDGTYGAVAYAIVNIDSIPIEAYHALYQPTFDPSHTLVEIASYYPWDEGTLSLLKTIHIETINTTVHEQKS
jgi:hypothetical protein